ncbi:MAG: FAD-dependent thymidylate synthase [Desulfamplus sp.]|nr:FAD-dependent thymidylate synthase [Desulfamplus sp.]
MNIIEPSFEILAFPESIELLEIAGRTCYRSEPKGEPEKFVKKIIDSQHLSVIEHLTATVKIVTDRGVLAELTRHRLASFSVESTRYVNYNKKGLEFVRPCFWDKENPLYDGWYGAMYKAESFYNALMESGATPEQARSVLPNSLKTEIIMSCNFREWLHIFKLRCSEKSHPQMREIMIPMRDEFRKRCPVVFGG